MKNLTILRSQAVHILRAELGSNGIYPSGRAIDTAMKTVHDGGFLLRTGAKLTYSARTHRYLLLGYAWDGADLAPYTDPDETAVRSADITRLFN